MSSVLPMMPKRKPDGLLSADQLAERWQVCTDTVYRLGAADLPFIRIGRYRRYRLADVLAFEERHTEGGR